MIKHIVMWKLKPEAEGRTAAENAQWMKNHLEALMGVVPQLLSCEVGINVAEGNYDACLVSTFASLEDLAAYQAVSSYCKLIREHRVACDYEI